MAFPLADLTEPDDQSIDDLCRLGELASGYRVHEGELTVLTEAEWSQRWRAWRGVPGPRAGPRAARRQRAGTTEAAAGPPAVVAPEVVMRPLGVVSHYNGLLAAEPANPDLLLGRARVQAALGWWDDAAADYARVMDLRPTDDSWVWFEHACLRLLSGDGDGYRRACAELPDRLAVRTDATASFLAARACTLAPDGPGAARLAEKELAGDPETPRALTLRAALHYRAGEFEEAARVARRCLEAHPGWDGNVLNWLRLALACRRLGQADEARRWLDKAAGWLDRFDEGMPAEAEGTHRLHLHDWLEAHLLRREAEALLREDAPPARE
jgi:tetratricopeptide (TPR) repeat protein